MSDDNIRYIGSNFLREINAFKQWKLHFCECQIIIHIREKFWDFVANNFDIELDVELHNLRDSDFVHSLFGANLHFYLI